MQVFYKHQDARFFRAKSYAMALVISGIPFSFMEVRKHLAVHYVRLVIQSCVLSSH